MAASRCAGVNFTGRSATWHGSQRNRPSALAAAQHEMHNAFSCINLASIRTNSAESWPETMPPTLRILVLGSPSKSQRLLAYQHMLSALKHTNPPTGADDERDVT